MSKLATREELEAAKRRLLGGEYAPTAPARASTEELVAAIEKLRTASQMYGAYLNKLGVSEAQRERHRQRVLVASRALCELLHIPEEESPL